MSPLRFTAVAAAWLALVAVATGQAQDVKPVGSVMDIMNAMTIPASTAIFDVGREEPATEEAWKALEHQALILAESGNLLMLGERARDKGEWVQRSRDLIDAGIIALEAARKKDAEAVLAAGDTIIEACENCHASYLTTP